MAVYLDSSALVKLIVEEAETVQLKSRITGHVIVSSELAVAEILRATLRSGRRERETAMALLQDAHLVAITATVLRTAGMLQTSALRTLDAVHVASALSLAEECECLVTYDRRMQEAAVLAGLVVEAPGQSR